MSRNSEREKEREPKRPVAVITGASSGLGEAFARILAKNHDLVLVARRKERLLSLVQELEQPALEVRRHRAVSLDLSIPGADLGLFAEVSSCDLLINCAGAGLYAELAEADTAKLAALIELNIRSLTMLTRRYLPGMIERRMGGVLNVASVLSFLSAPHMAAYAASKAYVLSFSEAVREEVKGSGVHVTCLCPGATKTEFAQSAGIDLGRDMAWLPQGLVYQSAEKVAKIGLAALAKNRPMIVSGAGNKLSVFSSRLAPRRAVTWVTGQVMRSRRS